MSAPIYSWRELVKVHPAAEVYDMLPDDAMRELVEDVGKNGLLNAVTIQSKSLVDGRNRLEALWRVNGGDTLDDKSKAIAAVKAAIDAAEKLSPSANVEAYVASLNAHRRHLTYPQKLEAAKKLLELNPNWSDRIIAKRTGLSPTTAGKVRSTVHGGQSEARTGADGKTRKLPDRTMPPPAASPPPPKASQESMVPKSVTPGPSSLDVAKEAFIALDDGDRRTFLDWAIELLSAASPPAAPEAATAPEPIAAPIAAPEPEQAPVAPPPAPVVNKGWVGDKPPAPIVCNASSGICVKDECQAISCCQVSPPEPPAEPPAATEPSEPPVALTPGAQELFDLWKTLSKNPLRRALKWVEDDCPPDYPPIFNEISIEGKTRPFRELVTNSSDGDIDLFVKNAKAELPALVALW